MKVSLILPSAYVMRGDVRATLNLASALAMAEQRVLLVDLDPQANLTSGVGLKGQSDATIYHGLTSDTSDGNGIVIPTKVRNLSLIPADRHLTGAEVELVTLAVACAPARDREIEMRCPRWLNFAPSKTNRPRAATRSPIPSCTSAPSRISARERPRRSATRSTTPSPRAPRIPDTPPECGRAADSGPWCRGSDATGRSCGARR